VVDLYPTILEAVGIEAPRAVNGIEQMPIHGVSMMNSIDDAAAAETHHTQYFEMFGNRAIYHDGWIASCYHGRVPWNRFGSVPFDGPQERWELYDIRTDFSQGVDLAAKYPDRLEQLKALFDAEALRNNVYPLKEPIQAFGPAFQVADALGNATSMTYTTVNWRMPERNVVNLKNCSFRISADVTTTSGTHGVIACQGGNMAGWSLYLDDESRPVYHYNWLGHEHFVARCPNPLAPGRHRIVVDFAYDGGLGAGGDALISVNGAAASAVRVERTVPVVFSMSGETFDVGLDSGSVVGNYPHVYKFTGTIHSVLLERLSEPSPEIRAIIADAEFRASLMIQ
jgi:arylsulfatase